MSTEISTARLSRAAVRPLATLDPAAPLDDLSWLDEVVGDARVVAIGESGHYTTEFPQLRHRVQRYLVERHGFRACAVENGVVEGRQVDDWVRGGPGELGPVLANGMNSLTGVWRSVRAQLEWLRAHNSTAAEAVGWYGFDLGGSNVSLQPMLDAVFAYFTAADPDFRPDPAIREIAMAFAVPSAFGIPAALGAYAGLVPERRDALTAGLAGLQTRLTSRRLPYLRRTGAEAYEWAVRALRATVTVDTVVRAMAAGDQETALFSREATSADTVEWILGRADRIVLGAHNGHVQRWPGALPGTGPITTLGVHLADRLGEEYRAIGTTSGPGQMLGRGFHAGELFEELPAPEPDSLDGVLAASHDGLFGVNLRTLDPADRDTLRAVTRQCHGMYYAEVDALAAYDALVHVPRVSAGEPDPEAIAAAPEDVREMFAKWQGSGG
ncbi:erythromycin esterase family protein [Crossiella sp. NPDC003009]